MSVSHPFSIYPFTALSIQLIELEYQVSGFFFPFATLRGLGKLDWNDSEGLFFLRPNNYFLLLCCKTKNQRIYSFMKVT